MNEFTSIRRTFVFYALVQALVGLMLTSAAAARDRSYGFVWASEPTTADYTPLSSFSYNSGGQTPHVTRTATGTYQVTFGGLDLGRGHAQATAYRTSGGEYCTVSNWNNTDGVTVRCYDASGILVDTRFTVLFLAPNQFSDNYAFARADQETAASYTPDSSYSHNAASSNPISIVRSTTGTYAVTFDGLTNIGWNFGHFQVTAYSSNARCKVQNWIGNLANIRCFAPDGSPADSRFTVLAWRPDEGDDGVAFAWANEATSASYVPDASFTHSPTNGVVSGTRSSTGRYSLDFVGYSQGGGNVQITAYGSDSATCSVDNWSATQVNVSCFDSAGSPIDSRFNVLFLKPPVASFAGLGVSVATEPATTFSIGSYVESLSANGNVVVGGLYEPFEGEMMRWTRPTGLDFVPDVIPGSSLGQIPVVGLDAANQAGTVLGGLRKNGLRRWLEGVGITGFSPAGLVSFSKIQAISDDSEALGGWADLGTRVSPWYHTDALGLIYIPHPDPTVIRTHGTVEGISTDGTYAVGWMSPGLGGAPSTPTSDRAYRWNVSTGVDFLPELDPDAIVSRANEVSRDGAHVVGMMSFGAGEEAFIWDEATDTTTGLGDIGAPSPSQRGSEAFDISAESQWVVGKATDGAFLWDPNGGMRLIKDMLEDQGFDLTGWTLTEAKAISEDGWVIVGNGINPAGEDEGWMAVPEPNSSWLLTSGTLALWSLAARRRRPVV